MRISDWSSDVCSSDLRDGRTIDVEITSYTLDFQQRAAVLVVARDVTESKRAEEALRESEAVARGVLNTALDAYIRMDQDGLITEWNTMAEHTFGWARSEVKGGSREGRGGKEGVQGQT